ncbi:MAG: Maf family protein [Hyphomicrobium sp.]
MTGGQAPLLILASGSQTRVSMLREAGLAFEAVPADIDEAALFKAALVSDASLPPEKIAVLLARAKAAEVSRRYPEALVIGADQVLSLGNEMIFKAPDQDAAKRILMKLRGQTHKLHSAVSLAIGGCEQWTAIDTASLTMRDFSAAFLDDYLRRAGSALTTSAGAYQIEGLGVNLFETVAGHHSTILGLPLLPLLAELRARGVIGS